MPLVFFEILTKTYINFIMTLWAFRKRLIFPACAINYFHRPVPISKRDIIFTASKHEYICFFREILAST